MAKKPAVAEEPATVVAGGPAGVIEKRMIAKPHRHRNNPYKPGFWVEDLDKYMDIMEEQGVLVPEGKEEDFVAALEAHEGDHVKALEAIK